MLMQCVAFRYVHKYERPAVDESSFDLDVNLWRHRVATDLANCSLDRVELTARHTGNATVIGDPQQQDAASSVGERHDLVRPGPTLRTRGLIVVELNSLELPVVVFAELQATEKLFVGMARSHLPEF